VHFRTLTDRSEGATKQARDFGQTHFFLETGQGTFRVHIQFYAATLDSSHRNCPSVDWNRPEVSSSSGGCPLMQDIACTFRTSTNIGPTRRMPREDRIPSPKRVPADRTKSLQNVQSILTCVTRALERRFIVSEYGSCGIAFSRISSQMCISRQKVHVVVSISGRADLDLSPTT
jgi:hypothetical protein